MADLNTKYLDYTGLGIFLSKLKEYIENRISEINGTNLNLRASGEDNPTLTSQIEDLWAAIGSTDGSGGSIIENIEKILGEYVKSISTPTEQSLPLKLVIIEGTEDNKDRFTIELQDNGLNDTLSTLTSARVSKITPANDGGAVTLTVDNNTGDVKITVNSKALTERIETLESRSGKYNARSGNGYLLVGTSSNNNSDWCSINASNLRCNSDYDGCELSAYGKMAIGTDFYGGISLGTLPDSSISYINIAPGHFTTGISIDSSCISIGTSTGGISIDSSCINIGTGGIIIGTTDIIIGARYGTKSISIGRSTGVNINGVIVGISNSYGWDDSTCIAGNLLGTAENSLALGGHSSDYFATASSHTALEERVDSLESDRIKSVAEGESKENYLTLDVSTSNLNTTITIDDTSLKEKIDEMDAEMDTFAKSESIPTKLPNPESLTVMWMTDKNAEITTTYDGSGASVVDLTDGVYYATTSTTATRVSNKLFITDKTGTSHEYNGSNEVNISSIASAGDADKLGGQLPSYYAKKSELNTLSESVSSIDARVTTNTTNISNEVTARQNADNALDERLDTIENSYVKSVKVTGTNGITATPTTATNGDVSISISGQELKESVEALGKVVNLTGVYAAGTALNTISGNDGDFIIVGQKEYVYWNTAATGVDGTKWILLGDTTQLSQDVSNLTTSYNEHKHSVTAKGTIENTFVGGTDTTKSISGSTEVSYISEAGTLPTKSIVEVASDKHTHTTSVTAKGTIENSFTGEPNAHNHNFVGNQNTTSSTGLTISYASGKLTITSAHTHTVTPTGTISDKTITPTGTVTSTFIGEAVSATSGNPSAAKEIGSITDVGTLPTYTNVEVASSTHTHTITPTGTVTSTFKGEAVDTSTKK